MQTEKRGAKLILFGAKELAFYQASRFEVLHLGLRLTRVIMSNPLRKSFGFTSFAWIGARVASIASLLTSRTVL